MDVLLIDDKEGESALLVREWESRGIRVLHSDDLLDVATMLKGETPPGWPEGPYDVAAAVIDLDLGHKGPGPAGGVVATQVIRTWRADTSASFPIVLRTADVDDDRSLAAVLAAEVVGGPLPLWGKEATEAGALLDFIEAHREHATDPAEFGARLVQPVRFVRDERHERLLGRFLYDGARADVWERLRDGFDAEAAILAAGYQSHNKFWEPINGLIGAIIHLRDNGVALHDLGGEAIRIADVEREMDLEVVADIDIAMYAVRALPDTTDAARSRILAALTATKQQYVDSLEHGTRRPSQNRNVDQGEFLGAFGRVLGHPEVVDIFKH